jgi:hypothetical protein
VGDIRLYIKVEIEGSVTGVNVLQVTRVIIKPDNIIRISVLVEAVNLVATTRFEDDSSSKVQQFGKDDIVLGDYIFMRGSFIGTHVVVSRVEREDFLCHWK